MPSVQDARKLWPEVLVVKLLLRLFLVLFFCTGVALAEQPAGVQRVGAALVNSKKSLSFWVVESQAGDRGVVVKVVNLDNEQQVNMLLDRTQLKELRTLCKKVYRFREKLADGESQTLGKLQTQDMSLEVLVVRSGSFTVRILGITEKGQTLDYYLDSFQEDSVMGLIEQAGRWLR